MILGIYTMGWYFARRVNRTEKSEPEKERKKERGRKGEAERERGMV